MYELGGFNEEMRAGQPWYVITKTKEGIEQTYTYSSATQANIAAAKFKASGEFVSVVVSQNPAGGVSSAISKGVDAAKDAASSIWGSIAKAIGINSGPASAPAPGLPARQSDNTMKYVLLGGLAIGAVYLLKKRKRR